MLPASKEELAELGLWVSGAGVVAPLTVRGCLLGPVVATGAYYSAPGLHQALENRVGHALVRSARDRPPPVLLVLDVEGFKHVNDAHGHAQGDALLVAVAERLRRQLRDEDTLARVGGDQFAVLLEGVDVVAEGIETERQVDALRSLGRRVGQGYHFARPQGAAAIGPLLGRVSLLPDAGRGEVAAAGTQRPAPASRR